jgi:hypothetical protein
MLTYNETHSTLSIPKTMKAFYVVTGTFVILMTVLAVLAYVPEHPDFSIFNTFLSDIGDTPGWPQIIWNSGTLIGSSLRFIVIVLLALRLSQMGTGKGFAYTVLIIGAFSTLGTVLLTAVPFSVNPAVHKAGIPLYFFGVVPMQIVIGLREWSLKDIPRLLPTVCFLVAGSYLVFFILVILYELGVVSRTTTITPMIWQWVGFGFSTLWLFVHGLVLGRE